MNKCYLDLDFYMHHLDIASSINFLEDHYPSETADAFVQLCTLMPRKAHLHAANDMQQTMPRKWFYDTSLIVNSNRRVLRYQRT